MQGFKQQLISEIRHGIFNSSIKLKVSEPVNGRFQTRVQDIDGIDMKYEFYLGKQSMLMMHKKFIQQFPEDVRTKDNQILINESYFSPVGGKFYAAEANPELLHRALVERKAYVDVKAMQLVEPRDDKFVIECEVNPLDKFHIPASELIDAETGVSAVREGWEQLETFNWWHFTMCTHGEGYAKKSCRYDEYEIAKLIQRQAA